MQSKKEHMLHKYYIYVPKMEIKQNIKHITNDELQLIDDCDKSGFITKMASELLQNTTNRTWLNSQINYVLSSKTGDILCQQNNDPTLSLASKLIHFLQSQ